MNKPEFKEIPQMTFSQCLTELEGIVKMMEADNCDIDLLAVYTTRASQLLTACRDRLTITDNELQKILSNLGGQD